MFYFYYIVLCLSSGNGLLDEVVLHVALEIEVSQLIRAGERKKLGEAGVGVDLATILLVLKTLLANVSVDLLADLRASHLGTDGLAKELGELIADASGLDEPRGLPVSSRLPLLGVLLGALQLAREDLLEGLVIALHRGEEAGHLLELGTELLNLEGGRGLGDGLGSGDNRLGSTGNRRRNDGGGRLGLLGTRLGGGLLGNNNVLNGGSDGCGLLIGLSGSDHF